MHDESRQENNYDMQENVMSKSINNISGDMKGQAISSTSLNQSSFLQNNGSKVKILQNS